jgi:hypothetical protein
MLVMFYQYQYQYHYQYQYQFVSHVMDGKSSCSNVVMMTAAGLEIMVVVVYVCVCVTGVCA